MNLSQAYKKIKPSIVAFVPKFHPVYTPEQALPEFPPIFGTGFIVADGLVVTNDHVINAINRLPKPPDCPEDLWPVTCLLLYMIPGKGIAEIPMEVIGAFVVEKMETGKVYYGPPKPDIGFVHVKMKDLPCVKVDYKPEEVEEGREVATAGFPMGTDTLMAPGYLHQLTPTLQKGVISAILPFECDSPHALMINVMTQGGASGSPVFFPDSDYVVGILYGGLHDIDTTIKLKPKDKIDPGAHSHFYKLPTNASYVVPSHYLVNLLDKILKDDNFALPLETPSLKTLIGSAEFVDRERGKPKKYTLWGKDEPSIESKLKKVDFHLTDNANESGEVS